MKRQIIILVVCVTWGGLINEVGWGLYSRSQRPSFQEAQRYEERPIGSAEITDWRRWSKDGWPDEPQGHLQYVVFAIRYQELYASADDSPSRVLTEDNRGAQAESRQDYWVSRTECGWPMYSIRLEQSSDSFPKRTTPVGALVNTLVYGGFIWILALPLSATKRSRARHPRESTTRIPSQRTLTGYRWVSTLLAISFTALAVFTCYAAVRTGTEFRMYFLALPILLAGMACSFWLDVVALHRWGLHGARPRWFFVLYRLAWTMSLIGLVVVLILQLRSNFA